MGVVGSSMSQDRIGKERKEAETYQGAFFSSMTYPQGKELSCVSCPWMGHAVMLLCLHSFGFGCLSTGQLMSSKARLALMPKRQQISSRGALAELTELT